MNEEAGSGFLLAPIPGGGLNSTNLPHPIASPRRLCWLNRTASGQNAFYANSIKGRAGFGPVRPALRLQREDGRGGPELSANAGFDFHS